MKVVAFNGSPRANGNTNLAIETVCAELKNQGIETEILHVGNKAIRGCLACGWCAKNKNEKCVIQDDVVNEYIQKMKSADGIIIASPVYYASIAGTMKSFLDRAFYVCSRNDSLLRHKVGASVVALRRSGGVTTFDQLNNYFLISEMFTPASNYWNVAHGRDLGETIKDEEGMQVMRVLGKNMAFLMKSIKNSKEIAPEKEEKVWTSFVR